MYTFVHAQYVYIYFFYIYLLLIFSEIFCFIYIYNDWTPPYNALYNASFIREKKEKIEILNFIGSTSFSANHRNYTICNTIRKTRFYGHRIRNQTIYCHKYNDDLYKISITQDVLVICIWSWVFTDCRYYAVAKIWRNKKIFIFYEHWWYFRQ